MTFLLANWRIILVALLLLGLAAWGQTMKMERDAIRADYAEFKTKVAQAAEAAAEVALKKTIEDEKRKENADRENAGALATLAANNGRLRAERDDARGRFLSAATSCPASPDGADRYRAEYESAYRDLVAGLRAEGDKGTRDAVGLNTAKRWAQEPR